MKLKLKSEDLKKFKKDLQELGETLRREISAAAASLDPSPSAILARRARVLHGDDEFFSRTYFPHHIRGDFSKFQTHFCNRFPQLLNQPGGVVEWWVAPRGECKSTLLTKIGSVFCVARELLQREEIRAEIGWRGPAPYSIDYIGMLGAESTLPTKLIEVIKTELTANAALELDFPEICGRGTQWKLGEIVTTNGVKFEAFGADQAVRGTFHGASRPKALFGDDLITDVEAKSEKMRKARWDWLTKCISFLGPPDGSVKFIGVGTVLHNDDPISRAKRTIGHLVHHFKALEVMPINMDLWEQCEAIMHNADKPAMMAAAEVGRVLNEKDLPSYKFYRANKAAMDEGAVFSWPSVRTLYGLMRARATSSDAFNTELQGIGRSDADKVFARITYFVEILRHWVIYAACDPSMGNGQKSDPSSIAVGGYDFVAKKMHVLYEKSKRRTPTMLSADLLWVQNTYNPHAIAFENNGAFEHSRQTFIDYGLERGVYIPLIGITATVSQELRIGSLEPLVCDGLLPRIILHATLLNLLSQLNEWPESPSGHHYDSLCALYLLWHICVLCGSGQIGTYTSAIASSDSPRPDGQPRQDRDNDEQNESGAW